MLREESAEYARPLTPSKLSKTLGKGKGLCGFRASSDWLRLESKLCWSSAAALKGERSRDGECCGTRGSAGSGD